jgi:hypothetical protein
MRVQGPFSKYIKVTPSQADATGAVWDSAAGLGSLQPTTTGSEAHIGTGAAPAWLERSVDKLHHREGRGEAWRGYGFDSDAFFKAADSGFSFQSSKSAWPLTKPGEAAGAHMGMPALKGDLQKKPPPGLKPFPPQGTFQPANAFVGTKATPPYPLKLAKLAIMTKVAWLAIMQRLADLYQMPIDFISLKSWPNCRTCPCPSY